MKLLLAAMLFVFLLSLATPSVSPIPRVQQGYVLIVIDNRCSGKSRSRSHYRRRRTCTFSND